MNSIDILIAVDGEKIAGAVEDHSILPGSLKKPTNLSYSAEGEKAYICMTTQFGNVDNKTQGSPELKVKANSGDTLRWTMQTFGSNMDHTAFIYAGHFYSSKYNNSGEYITPLTFLNINSSLYLPPSTDPTVAPGSFHNAVYAAQATIVKPVGRITYNLSFALVNNSSGSVIGYFKWDPYINVSP